MVYYTPQIQSESTLIKTYLILFQLQTVKQRANQTECCLQTYFYMHDVCLKFWNQIKKNIRKPLIRHLAERMHAELHVIYVLYAHTYCLMQFTVVNQLQPDMARRQRKYVNNSV